MENTEKVYIRDSTTVDGYYISAGLYAQGPHVYFGSQRHGPTRPRPLAEFADEVVVQS